MDQGLLVLADGMTFRGRSFGYPGETFGEVVFNTSISGYQEILTDPSYTGQIVTLTYPMIGNYGINGADAEADRPMAAGLIVKEYAGAPSNWRSEKSLQNYLLEHQIVAVDQMPTREIVRHIRNVGTMSGILAVGNVDLKTLKSRLQELSPTSGQNLVEQVSTKKIYTFEGVGKKVIVFDFGVKQNILRELQSRGCEVTVVPASTLPEEISKRKPDGILFSNGPGDPAACSDIIANIQKMVGTTPMMGICLGHQLLSLAFGAKTFKMKFGHRGGNQPVKNLLTGKVLITAQNHGFAVSTNAFPESMEVTQINLNDKTIEAFRHKKFPIISVQYHPEAGPGPNDAKNIFDEFVQLMSRSPATPLRTIEKERRENSNA